ncbi:MAG TPA: phosphatase PAP2 family protein [Gemmatimonadaceae bacterium]|nr:phosphatase PAP2 family protein [Gemmatimonadaceae bacterium]
MTASAQGPTRWRRFVAERMDPKAYLGLHVTVGLAVVALGLWLFGALLDAVLDNAMMVRWDVAADAWVHARATPAGLRAFDVVTQLGSPAAMAALGAAGALVLWRARRHTTLIAWLAAFGGGAAVDWVLKSVVHRARPTYGNVYLHGHSYSFPSGHAMGSAIGYAMLVYVAGLYWHPANRAWRTLGVVAAAAIVVAVGLSRVYLGVHYPSDVIGGWAAAAAWLSVCLTGMSIAQGRSRLVARGPLPSADAGAEGRGEPTAER